MSLYFTATSLLDLPDRWLIDKLMLLISLFLIFVKKQSQELTRVNPDRNIFSINVELTSTFLLYRGLVHHHHRILNVISMSLKHMGTSNYTNLKLLWLIQHQSFAFLVYWGKAMSFPAYIRQKLEIWSFDSELRLSIHCWGYS